MRTTHLNTESIAHAIFIADHAFVEGAHGPKILPTPYE